MNYKIFFVILRTQYFYLLQGLTQDFIIIYGGTMRVQDIIKKKRDKLSLTEEEMFHEILLRSLYQHDMNIDSTLYFKLCDILFLFF